MANHTAAIIVIGMITAATLTSTTMMDATTGPTL